MEKTLDADKANANQVNL